MDVVVFLDHGFMLGSLWWSDLWRWVLWFEEGVPRDEHKSIVWFNLVNGVWGVFHMKDVVSVRSSEVDELSSLPILFPTPHFIQVLFSPV